MSGQRKYKSIVTPFPLLFISIILSGCLSGGESKDSAEPAVALVPPPPPPPPANSAPQISGTAPASVTVGQNYQFTPTSSDADGDTLTFSVTGLPSRAAFDTATGRISGTPVAADVGTHTNIVITASDGQASTSLAPFSITVHAEQVTNSAPQLSGTAPGSVTVGESYQFTPTSSDADGDVLTFSVTGLPSWASFNSTSGGISGTPIAADVGTYTNIVITASDGQASASLAPFSIDVQSISLGSVTLSWVAPTENDDGSVLTDLDGYKIYWGTIPGEYPNSITIDNASISTYVVDNLSPGTYEFVATSFNSAGVESVYSNSTTKVVL